MRLAKFWDCVERAYSWERGCVREGGSTFHGLLSPLCCSSFVLASFVLDGSCGLLCADPVRQVVLLDPVEFVCRSWWQMHFFEKVLGFEIVKMDSF